MENIIAAKSAIIAHCRACRKYKGFTLVELALRCGIHYTALSNFENGKFSFDKAIVYYNECMSEEQRHKYSKLLDDLKTAYLDGGIK